MALGISGVNLQIINALDYRLGKGYLWFFNQVVELTTDSNGECEYTIRIGNSPTEHTPIYASIINAFTGTMSAFVYLYDESARESVKFKLKFTNSNSTFIIRLQGILVYSAEEQTV